jgi:hypothetical protein
VTLENRMVTLVMCQEQPKSINHMLSNPPSITYIGWKEIDSSVIGLVR